MKILLAVIIGDHPQQVLHCLSRNSCLYCRCPLDQMDDTTRVYEPITVQEHERRMREICDEYLDKDGKIKPGKKTAFLEAEQKLGFRILRNAWRGRRGVSDASSSMKTYVDNIPRPMVHRERKLAPYHTQNQQAMQGMESRSALGHLHMRNASRLICIAEKVGRLPKEKRYCNSFGTQSSKVLTLEAWHFGTYCVDWTGEKDQSFIVQTFGSKKMETRK